MRIRTVIIAISGWGQQLGQPTGTRRWWHELRKRSNEEMLVLLLTWNADFEQIAELIFQETRGIHVVIYVVGYSWGGGNGCIKLIDALAKRGMGVTVLGLIDAVYHSNVPGWNLLRAFIHQGQIVIDADKVGRVAFVFRQRRDKQLRGHRIVSTDPQVLPIPETRWLDCEHRYADDQPEVFDAVLEEAEKLFGKAA